MARRLLVLFVSMAVLAGVLPAAADAQGPELEGSTTTSEPDAPDDPPVEGSEVAPVDELAGVPRLLVEGEPRRQRDDGDRWPWQSDRIPAEDRAAGAALRELVAPDEVLEERTATSKTFATDAPGVFRTEFFGDPVFYEDERGELVDIDPDLVEQADGSFVAEGMPVEVVVPDRGGTGGLATVSADGWSVGFSLVDGVDVDAVEIQDDTIAFDDVAPGTDIELELLPAGVKETIYLESAAAADTMLFDLELVGVRPVLDVNGHVWFEDAEGTRVAVIPRPWMEDANIDRLSRQGVRSYDIAYELTETRTGWQLRVVPDATWLADPARVFPVRVDPTVTMIGDDEATDDTIVGEGVVADLSLLGFIGVGDNGTDLYRSFWNPSGMGQVDDKTIHSADFRAWQFYQADCEPSPLEAYRVTEAWTESTTTMWPGPATDELIGAVDTPDAQSCDPQWVSMDVTGAMRNWSDGTWGAYGLSLRAGDETDPNQLRAFHSSDNLWKPRFEVLWSDLPTAGQSPDAPTDITPNGPESTDTPTLSAVYTDPNNADGKVTFYLYENGGPIGTYTPTASVTSGSRSEFTLTAPLVWDTTYEIVAVATNDDGYTAAAADPVFFTTQEPTLITANITEDTVWGPQNSPYVIDSSGAPINRLYVHQSAVLTVLPGTVVKFAADSELWVQKEGSTNLLVLGTEADPVVFTSIKDDTAGGDTNGDGSVSVPAPGDWRTLNVAGSSSGVDRIIDNAEFRYGGRDAKDAMLGIGKNTPLLVSNSVFGDSAFHLVETGGSNCSGAKRLRIVNNVFRDTADFGFKGNALLYGNTFEESIDSWALKWPSSLCGGEVMYNTFGARAWIQGTESAPVRYNQFLAAPNTLPTHADRNYGDGAFPRLTAPPAMSTPALAESNAPQFGPVDGVSGALTWATSDISMVDAGQDVSVDRVYQSDVSGPGELGDGWFTSYSEVAAAGPSGGGSVSLTGGANLDFPWDDLDYGPDSGPGEVVPSPGNQADFSSDASGSSMSTPNGTTYGFDALGELTSVSSDARDAGVELEVVRGPSGIDRIEGVSGRVLEFTHAGGPLSSVTDGSRTVNYAVTGGNLVSVTGVDGKATTYGYDPGTGNLSLVTSPEDRPSLQAGYQADGKVAWFELAGEGRVTVDYQPAGMYTTFTRADGGSIRVDYDDEGRLVQRTVTGSGPGEGRHVVYDGWGNVTAVVSGLPTAAKSNFAPSVEITVIDANGDPTDVFDSYANRVKTTFTVDHRPEVTTYPNGDTVTRTWTDGRLSRVIRSDVDNTELAAWDFTYNGFGQRTSVTDPMTGTGSPVRVAEAWAYETNGDLDTSTDTAGAVTDYTTDPATGWVSSVKDPLLRETFFEYALWGAVNKTTSPEGNVTETQFDDDRAPERFLAPEGKVTLLAYDGMGRLEKRTDAEGLPEEIATELGYDPVGRVNQIIDGEGGVTTRTYNAGGDLEDVTGPAGGFVDYTYNAVYGRVDTQSDADGDTTQYTYGRDREVLKVVRPDNATVEFDYDDMGRQVEQKGPRPGAKTTTTYDFLGYVDEVFDPNGEVVDYGYDQIGRLISGVDQNNNQTSFGYDAADRQVMAADEDGGQLWAVDYDDAGQLDWSEDGQDGAADARTRYEYNGDGVITKITNAEDEVTWFPAIDGAGRATRVLGPDATAADVDCVDPVAYGANPACFYTEFDYDALDRVTQVDTPTGTDASPAMATESFVYDDNSNLLVRTDANNQDWVTTYDAANRPQTATDPEGARSVTCYEPSGDVDFAVDATGVVAEFGYDTMGRTTSTQVAAQTAGTTCGDIVYTDVGSADMWTYWEDGQVKSSDVAGAVTNYTYTIAGWPNTVADADNNKTTYDYQVGPLKDRVGNPLEIRAPKGNTDTFTYDVRNRVDTRTDATDRTWAYEYDLSDRPTETQWPDWDGTTGRRDLWTYDDVGRILTATDGDSNQSSYLYDDAGRLSEVDQPGSGADQYTYGYDRAGNLNSELRPESATAFTYTYDGTGAMVGVAAPSGRATTFGVDDAGRVIEEAVAYEGVTEYRYTGYDAAGRVDWADGPTTGPRPVADFDLDFGYDTAGRLDTSESVLGAVTYTYDDRHRRETSTQPVPPAGATATTTYGYDNRGLLDTVSASASPTVTFGYDKAARLETATTASSTQTWQYDDAGRVEAQYLKDGGTTLWRNDIGYGPNGLLNSRAQTAGSETIDDTATYDDAGRIASLQRVWDPDTGTGGDEATANLSYDFDDDGNRFEITATGLGAGPIGPDALGLPATGGPTYTWAVDNAGQLTGGPAGTETYSYDADGRLLEVTGDPNADDLRHTYDAFGDLQQTDVDDGAGWQRQSNYVRDALGRPVARGTAANKIELYGYDGLTNNVNAYAPDLYDSSIGTQIVRSPSGRAWMYNNYGGIDELVVANTRGDVVATIDAAAGGALNSLTTYDPYGNTYTTGATQTPLGYQGQITDPDTGYTEMGARSYDPTLGRFLQADIYRGDNTNPITLNRYTYANANPLNNTDLTGFWVDQMVLDAARGVAKKFTDTIAGWGAGASTGGSGGGSGLAGVTASSAVDDYRSYEVQGQAAAYLGALQDGGKDRDGNDLEGRVDYFTLVAPRCLVEDFAVQSYMTANFGRADGPPACSQDVVDDLPGYLAQQRLDRDVAVLAEKLGDVEENLIYQLAFAGYVDCADDLSFSTPCVTSGFETAAGPLGKALGAALKGLRGIRYLDEATDVAARGGDEAIDSGSSLADDAITGGSRAADDASNGVGQRIFRAVKPDELADLARSGEFQLGEYAQGLEGKYFWPSGAQADDFAALATKSDGMSYCVTSGCIPSNVLSQIDAVPMDGLGSARRTSSPRSIYR